MKITKFAQSCLLVEEGDARILIDPGSYSTAQNDVKNLDVVLITQIHSDHLDIESVRKIVQNNPGVKIFTVNDTHEELKKNGIESEILGHGQSTEVKGVAIEGFGEKHEVIYSEYPLVDNTGYMIAGRFYHPGDTFYKLEKPIEILALPVGGPWLKISEAIDYAKSVKPKVCFPIHDANFKDPKGTYNHAQKLLPSAGIEFVVIEEGQSREF